jgi:peptidoglycan/LPS O-acetylase OafA/YrhL
MQPGQEIKPLTGLRGIAAIYVVLYHYSMGLPFSSPEATFLAHGYFAVDLFFVLSGFVMALNYAHMFGRFWSTPAYLKFLGRRIARIYPLYFAMTLCACFLAAVGFIEPPHATSIGVTFLPNLVMVQSWGLTQSLDYPAWSISAEWGAYLLFPLLLAPCLFHRPSLAVISGAVCVAILAVLSTLPQYWAHQSKPAALLDISDPRLALPVLRCVPEFALGLLAFRVAGTPFGPTVAESRWIAPALCLGAGALMMIPGADLAVVLVFPLLVLSLTSDRHVAGRILACPLAAFLGQLSYSIYLTHNLMGGVLTWTHRHAEGFGLRHAQIYAAAVALLLTFPCAFLAYRFIEAPGRRWLRALFEGAPPGRLLEEPPAR